MYFGHFAVGMAMKAKYQDVPVWPLILGAGFLDVVNGVLVVLGINTVTANLEASPYLFFDLTFIDWDHSLLMAVFWSVLWGACFWKDCRVACLAAVACFLHFVVDVPMHNDDMAWYPYSEAHLGWGLWGRWGTGAWVLELGFAAVLLLYAWRQHQKRGENIGWQCAVVALLAIKLSPWFSPMQYVARLPEPYASLVHGVLVTAGFVVPTVVLACFYRRSLRLQTR